MFFTLKYVKYITKYKTIAPGSEFCCLLNFDLKFLVDEITIYTLRLLRVFIHVFFYRIGYPGFLNAKFIILFSINEIFRICHLFLFVHLSPHCILVPMLENGEKLFFLVYFNELFCLFLMKTTKQHQCFN